MKYKFATKITGSNQKFLMIFGGSSVTSGSDNCFNQTYPIVFERRMMDAFNALGVKLMVHNIAQPANQCIPSDMCYIPMGGHENVTDPDWFGWEQSFNCGRQPSIFELMARIAAHHNAIIHYHASGRFESPKCEPSKVCVVLHSMFVHPRAIV